MGFVNPGAELFVPDEADYVRVVQRAQGGCMAIGAHQDDLEIFAMEGIGQCFGRARKMFTGVTVTNGGGSSRKGLYASRTDEEMMAIRKGEQREAAALGRYSAQYQLDYKSSDIKGGQPARGGDLARELHDILIEMQPETLYTHNPFDKHETHLAVTRAVVEALRSLPEDKRPARVLGCEVWRGLDWLPDSRKVMLDVSAYTDLQRRLIDCHDSQIAGSKNYTEATLGREFANATYSESHFLDKVSAATFAVDLMPLVADKAMTMEGFVQDCIDDFRRQLTGAARAYELRR